PDRPGAKDGDALSDLESGKPHAVDGDPERLAQSGGGKADAGRDAEAVPGRHLDVLGEAPRDRDADHADLEAALILTGQAVATAAARGAVLESDRTARPEARTAGIDICDLGPALVTGQVGGAHT